MVRDLGTKDRRSASSQPGSAPFGIGDAAFREIFIQHPVPTWISDWETHAILEVNTAASARYGYTRDEFLAMRIDDLHPDRDTKRGRAAAAGAARHRLKGGQVIDVELSIHELVFRDRPAAMVVARDTGERHPIAVELHRSARQQRALLDVMPDLFFHLARDGTYLAYKAEHHDALVVPPGDVVGKRVDEVLPAPVARNIMATIEHADQGRNAHL